MINVVDPSIALYVYEALRYLLLTVLKRSTIDELAGWHLMVSIYILPHEIPANSHRR